MNFEAKFPFPVSNLLRITFLASFQRKRRLCSVDQFLTVDTSAKRTLNLVKSVKLSVKSCS